MGDGVTSSVNTSTNQTAGHSGTPSPADTAAQSEFASALNEAVSTVAGNGLPPHDLPDAGKLGFSQLVEDIDKTSEWISRQTTCSPEINRMTERLQELRKELAKRQDGMHKAASAPKGKAISKSLAREPASSDAMPRMLRERSSIQYGSPDEARAEVDRTVAWLQRSDVSRADRRLLQTELDNLAPQFEQGRLQHAQERRTQVITQALAPSSGFAGAKAQVLDSLARIDGIVALPDRPGFFALMRGSEQIVLTGEEVAQLRTSAEKSLDTAAKQARGVNETTFGRLNDHMKLNYEEHPYVGFAVSGVSGEEPIELYDRVQPMVAKSNSTLTRYRQQAEAGAPLAKRAAILLEGVEGAERAHVTLDKGVDRAMSAAGDIVTGLTVTRDLSFAISLSLGAVVAAPVVAAGVGAGGLGLTGAGAVAATGVGTGAVVGTGGFALRGGSAVAGELAAGHSLEQAVSVGWQEGKRGAKEGFVSGLGGGVGLSTGRALGLGAQQFSRAQTIARSAAAGSAGGGSSELARGIIEQRGVVDTLKGTGKGLVLGGGGGLIGGASSTISNPVLRQTAAIGGDVALNAGVAYAETSSVREAVLAGASSIAVSGSVAAARQHPPSAKVPMDQRDINAIRNSNGGTVSGEIVNRMLPDGAPHAPAQPKVIVDRSAYNVEPGQAGKTKALGLDPSKTSAVAHASDGHGADFDVVASPARPSGAGGRSTPAVGMHADIGNAVDAATAGTGTAGRTPVGPEELGGAPRRPEVDDPGLPGPQRLRPEPSLGIGAEAARTAGLPSEVVDSGYVYTARDLPDVVPETGFSGARPARESPPLAEERGRGVAGRRPTAAPDWTDVQNSTVTADLHLIEDHLATLNSGLPPGSRWTIEDVRINRTQVAEGATGPTRASSHTRPDLQFTIRDPQGGTQRFLIEYDRSPPTRALGHARGILERDPTAIVILKIIGFD